MTLTLSQLDSLKISYFSGVCCLHSMDSELASALTSVDRQGLGETSRCISRQKQKMQAVMSTQPLLLWAHSTEQRGLSGQP